MALFRRGFVVSASSLRNLALRRETESLLFMSTYSSTSWIFLVLMLIHPSFPYSPTSCLSIQSSCVQRRGCASALHHYLLSCAYLISGQPSTDECSVRCQRALVTLVSATTEEPPTQYHYGWSSSSLATPTQHHHEWPLPSFMSCTCGENALCRSQRAKLDGCLDGVTRALHAVDDEGASVPCALAEQLCRADTSCLTAIEFYGRNCGYLLQTNGGDGSRCLSRCRNSVRVLYRQRQSLKLRSCHCDGTEDYDCRTLQSRTQQFCVDAERESTKSLTPGQKFKHHSNSTRFRQATPSLTGKATALPPPDYYDSVNSGSRQGVNRRTINYETLTSLLLLSHAVEILRSGGRLFR